MVQQLQDFDAKIRGRFFSLCLIQLIKDMEQILRGLADIPMSIQLQMPSKIFYINPIQRELLDRGAV